MPTAEALLKEARLALSLVETPALDARLLLQHATGLDHAALVADPDMDLDDGIASRFRALVSRRAAREPVSRIVGEREFYGRRFKVTHAVLDPRPDTEVLVDAVLALLPINKPVRILDLGTGSGILAVTLAAERVLAEAVAVDLSPEALEIATSNANMLGVSRIAFLQGDWFGPVTGRFDVIVSNPPYIPVADGPELAADVLDHDPHLALFGGDDGLSCYRSIAAQALDFLLPHGFVAVEIGAGQAEDVACIFAASGLSEGSRHADLGGHVRCLVFRRGSQKR